MSKLIGLFIALVVVGAELCSAQQQQAGADKITLSWDASYLLGNPKDWTAAQKTKLALVIAMVFLASRLTKDLMVLGGAAAMLFAIATPSVEHAMLILGGLWAYKKQYYLALGGAVYYLYVRYKGYTFPL